MLRNQHFQDANSQFIYDLVVPQNHFLRKLNELMDWEDLAQDIFRVYKGGFQLGKAPINPITLLKMLLLGYLYNLSARDVERYGNENMPFKWFLQVGISEPVPDHSTITYFQNRILKYYGDSEFFKKLFDKIVRKISDHPEIKFGSSQIIDSTHIQAKVSAVSKEKDKDSKESKNSDDNNKPPRIIIDEDASFGCKGMEKKRDGNGNSVLIPKYFFGYKKHSSIENKYRFITSSIVSTGKEPDNEYMEDLLWADMAKRGIIEGAYADKGYDDGDLHFFLNQMDIEDGIFLRDLRFKDERKRAIWDKIANTPFYERRSKERYKIEPVFGDEKQHHKLRRSPHIGLVKTSMHCYLSDMAYNLKKMVKVLFNISPRCVCT